MNAKLNPILAGLVAAAFFAGSAYAAESLDTRADVKAETSIKVNTETNKTVSIKGFGEGAGSAENGNGKGAGKGASALGSGKGEGKGSAVTRSGAGEGKGSSEAALHSVSRVEQNDTKAEYVSSDTKQRSDVRAEQADTRGDRTSSDTKQRSDARAEQNATTDANASSYSQARAEQADTIDHRVSGDTQQRAESRDNNFENAAALALRAQLDQAGKLAQPGAIAGSPVSMPDFNPSYAMPSGAITGGAAMSAGAPSIGGPAMNATPSFSGSAAVSGSVNFGR